MCECQNKQEYRYDEQKIVDYVKMNCASKDTVLIKNIPKTNL